MDNERMREQEALLKVLQENFAQLTGFEGVTSAGVGFRVRGGEYTDELCIYVEVAEKLPPSALREGQMIPASVAGVTVDVVERPDRVLEDLLVRVEDLGNATQIRPLEGGYQITNGIAVGGKVSLGTLGAMIYVPEKKDPYVGIMSNQHVMFANGGKPGDSIAQPSTATVGSIVGGVKDSELDFAVARMANTVTATNKVRLIGTLRGFGGAVVGMRVRKCGITTDLTTGQITKVGVWCSSHGMCVFTGLEMVQGWPTPNTSQRFSAPGDSGSVVVDDDDKVVGLHYAGTQTAPFTSFSNDIRRVRQRIGEFQIPIPNPFQMVQLLGDDGRLARYRSELERTGHGREILAAFVENVGEGIRLVNSNRACMVAWQRFKAPAFISVRKGLDVDEPYVLRKEIDGVALDEMLTTMRQLFIEHGSPRMAEALRKHADEMIQLVQDHDSVDDVVKAVSTPRE